jgi:hypothetical protein|tara:strand:- start:1970 stop:2668 length:699 start_codon:yes stop_codon:yes gene_type:complete
MKDKAKLVEKIQKLLAMAKHNASNETEAATALRQAESMMRKHEIDFADINAQKLSTDDMSEGKTGESRNSSWVWTLAWAASYLTSTLPWRRYGEITFCGTKEDVQVALLMHDYLVGVTERLATKYQGEHDEWRHSLRAQRNAFKMGLVRRVCTRCSDLKDAREKELTAASVSGKDLVIVKSDLIKKSFPMIHYSSPKKQSTSCGDSYHSGVRSGNGVSLNDQVGSTKRAMIA